MNHLECVTSKRYKWYWYLLVFFFAFMAANTVGSIPLAVIMLVSTLKNGINTDMMQMMSMEGVDNNLRLFGALFAFVILLLAAIWLIQMIHGRSWREVINGTKRVRWSRFFFAFAVFGIFSLISFVYTYFTDPDNLVFQFNPLPFFILLIIAILFIPLQSSAEEFLFRGYLTQGVASWTKSRWWALIIPSVLFGLMHSVNPEIQEYGFAIMMPQYIFMGFLFGCMSILDDGIELAMGVHTANNLIGSVLLTFKGSALPTDALFYVKEMDPAAEILPLIISGVVLLTIFAVKYKWNLSVLNQKVELDEKKYVL